MRFCERDREHGDLLSAAAFLVGELAGELADHVCSSTSWEHMGRRPFGAAISGERCEIAAARSSRGLRSVVLECGDGGTHGLIDVVAILVVGVRDGQQQGLRGRVVLDALGERGTLAAQMFINERLRAVVDLALVGIAAEDGNDIQLQRP